MIEINLLPVREWRRREAVRRQVSLLILSTLLLFVALFAVGVTYQQRLQARRAELRRLEAQKRKLQFVERKIAQIQATRKELEEKFKTMEQLQQGRTRTVQVLDQVVQALPVDRVWLTRLAFDGKQITMSGVALDNHTVALFMRRLEASPWFSGVRLTNTSLTRRQDQQLTNFGLTVAVGQPPARAKAGGKGKG